MAATAMAAMAGAGASAVAAIVAGSAAPSAPLSGYEVVRGGLVAGDVGISVALPDGEDLWLRGDTPYYSGVAGSYTKVYTVHGSSAAEGPYAPGIVPQAMSELSTPPKKATGTNGYPHRFLPNPTDLLRPGSDAPCDGSVPPYADAMATGAVLDPGTYSAGLGADRDVLITYDEICVAKGSISGVVEGWGVAEYDWSASRFDVVHEVFAPAPEGAALAPAAALGSPVVRDGVVYLYSSVCDAPAFGGCGKGRVFGAEVADTAASLEDPGSYRFVDPAAGGTTADPVVASAQTTSLVPSPAGSGPFGVSVGDYTAVAGYHGAGLEMVAMTDVGGGYQLWQSASALGPWTLQARESVPGCGTPPKGQFCYAFVGHPELSTGSAMLFSYFDPTYLFCANRCSVDRYLRHLYVLAVPWPT